ncbi:heavy-metal-associated domain-containing protein [Flavobacterium undicola]|uniref:heavy-metal-associated domain-containing protein n=1 Tax=Flavobacterium undicola TaxID=1932779 RepID=UPI001376D3B6|nr:heavy-metal-associated domain-containing protein [Flavobacterium undicola]MBA0883914.1 heavy-metal-associated domain-containing protein [Flavobacterium undicola]
MENKHKTLQFKTNINCGGCIATVTPFLNETEGVCHWEVDTTNKDKILTVETTEINEQQIIETVQKAGFKIEPLNS